MAQHTNMSLVPFVITMVVALLISSYMLFDPANWLYELMGLTFLSDQFKAFMLALAVGGFCCSYAAEKYIFPQLARLVGKTKQSLSRGEGKRRKQYKVIMESMRF